MRGEAARWEGEDLLLALRVQPRARHDEVCGLHGGRLKVRITAPPADGKANRHLLRFLATLFDVPLHRVELIKGESSRDKQVRIHRPASLPDRVPLPPPSSDSGSRR